MVGMTGGTMLKALRKKGVAKKVIWAVAIIIIISFGFFGTAYLLTGSGRTGYAGKLFGKKISIDDFNKVYQDTRIQAIRQYGYNLNKVAHLLNLEAQTWDRLILLHEAKKRKIKISNDEVVEAIRQDQSFERNGQFDTLLYNAILRNLRIRARDYEESVRDNLKIAELYKQATSSVTLSEEAIFEEYRKRNEKVQVSYVFVSPELFKEDVSADAAQAEQYFENHKSEFLMPPTVNVQYLTLDFPEVTESAEEAAQKESMAFEEEKDLVREKAESVFQELLINPDMADVARQYNLTMQTSGFFSMEQPNLALGWSYDLLDKIFKMKENDVNEPFEISSGLLIVQIKEKRGSYTPEFNEVSEKAREAVMNEGARKIAEAKTGEYLDAIEGELDKSKLRDFPKAAKALKLEIHQTPVFSRGQYLPQIGISKEFQEAAFQLTKDKKISDVVETATGYCILHLDNYIPVENSEYEKSKEELAQTLAREKQNTVFGDFVAQLRLEANLENNLPQLRDLTQ